MSDGKQDVSSAGGENSRRGGKRRGAMLLALLLLIGLGVRVFSAWAYRQEPFSDAAQVGLMAKHMAEGTDFPVFFYGQDFMGSLEPAFSALLCFLFGTSGFAVCLGTALVMFLVLPLVYLWGRDAGGRTAGLVALAFCIFGPFEYFYLAASPRGGYGIALAAGTFILWWSGRIALDEYARRYVAPWRYACLGLVGGLAWWSNQLVTAALITAAIVLAVSLRLRVFKARVFLAGSLFALGCMPWWLWNIFHQWSSIGFLGAMGFTSPGDGCKLLGEMLAGLLEITRPYEVMDVVSFVVYVSAVLLGILFIARRPSSEQPVGYRVHLATALLFIGVSSLLFCSSRRLPATRYLLPFLPAIAVLIGTATAWLSVRMKHGLALIPVACLIASHLDAVPRTLHMLKEYSTDWSEASAFADFCEAKKIDAVYGGFWEYWVDFASSERCCLCRFRREPYAPYEKRAELAGNCGALKGLLGEEECARFDKFIRHTGASAAVTSLPPFELMYEARPSTNGWRLMDPVRILSASDHDGSNVFDLVCDEDMATFWTAWSSPATTGTLEIVFKTPESVDGIRILSGKDHYPDQIAIEGKMPDGRWKNLLKQTDTTGYFWSGPRFFWRSLFYRQEFRFAPIRIEALRIQVNASKPYKGADLNEIQVFEASGTSAVPNREDVAGLIDTLAGRGTDLLCADRWESLRVYEMAGDRIAVEVAPCMDRTINDEIVADTPSFARVDRLSARMAFLAPVQEADVTRRTLARRHIAMRETAVGPWVLFDFAPDMWKPVYADIPFDCFWTGTALLPGTSMLSAKRESMWLYALAGERYRASTGDPEVVELLEQAVEAYQAFELPYLELIAVLSGSGRTEDAARYASARKALILPEVFAPVAFTNGVQLLGVYATANGRQLTIEWRWKCPPGLNTSNLVTFVQFIRGSRDCVFQDDHSFLWSVPQESLRFQPLEEVFSVVREVTVPNDAPPGRYRMIAGLWDPLTGLRLKPLTKLRVESDAVEIPLILDVQL